MKVFATVAALALGLIALRRASQRLATHQPVLPEVSSRINTRVIRINQNRPMRQSSSGSVPTQQGDALP